MTHCAGEFLLPVTMTAESLEEVSEVSELPAADSSDCLAELEPSGRGNGEDRRERVERHLQGGVSCWPGEPRPHCRTSSSASSVEGRQVLEELEDQSRGWWSPGWPPTECCAGAQGRGQPLGQECL